MASGQSLEGGSLPQGEKALAGACRSPQKNPLQMGEEGAAVGYGEECLLQELEASRQSPHAYTHIHTDTHTYKHTHTHTIGGFPPWAVGVEVVCLTPFPFGPGGREAF